MEYHCHRRAVTRPLDRSSLRAKEHAGYLGQDDMKHVAAFVMNGRVVVNVAVQEYCTHLKYGDGPLVAFCRHCPATDGADIVNSNHWVASGIFHIRAYRGVGALRVFVVAWPASRYTGASEELKRAFC